jgi:hypothetical protein
MKIDVTPYELKLILSALDFSAEQYDGEESVSDMAELSVILASLYGEGSDEGKDKYTDTGDV